MDGFAEKIEILPGCNVCRTANCGRGLMIILGALYFCSKRNDRPVQPNSKILLFSTDSTLQYTPFFADFGPLHLGLTYKFCEQMDTLLTQGSVEHKPVVYYTSGHPHYRANSAVLLCAYMIFVKGFNAEMAYQPFMGISPMLTTFRDAAFAINTYPVTVLDCARAFYRARCLNHFDYFTFDIYKYEHLAKLENGDVSWIIPGKFIAFSGPTSTPREVGAGLHALSPEGYVPLFKSLGVTCVVRFNKRCYDRNIFIRNGIRHVDLFYEDGGNPTDAILQAFIQTCENEKGAIAVHCKAGLGRTGTNIAAYMMKHYGYSARETTAWCRVCRPGSVVGPQQQYLETIQEQMWLDGRRYRAERTGGSVTADITTAVDTKAVSVRGDSSSGKASGGRRSSGSGRRRSGSDAALFRRRKMSRDGLDVVDSALTSRLLKETLYLQQYQRDDMMSVRDRCDVQDTLSFGGDAIASRAIQQSSIHQLRPSTSSGMEGRGSSMNGGALNEGGGSGAHGNGTGKTPAHDKMRQSMGCTSSGPRRGSKNSTHNTEVVTRPKTSSSPLMDRIGRSLGRQSGASGSQSRTGGSSSAVALPTAQRKSSSEHDREHRKSKSSMSTLWSASRRSTSRNGTSSSAKC